MKKVKIKKKKHKLPTDIETFRKEEQLTSKEIEMIVDSSPEPEKIQPKRIYFAP